MPKSSGGETSDAAIGRRLAITRQVRGLLEGRVISQLEFCDRAGIAPTTYNQWELGAKRPSIESAIALCECYNLALDWIYRGDPSGLRHDMAEAIKVTRQVGRLPQSSKSRA